MLLLASSSSSDGAGAARAGASTGKEDLKGAKRYCVEYVRRTEGEGK
jgi:hypothetical protein